MKLIISFIFLIFGVVLGSFYNVVGYRLCEKMSLIKPRSHCPKCGHTLTAKELIPIFSYLFQKGKCRNCACKISIFYPLIELFTGILFAVSFYSFSFSYELIIALVLSSMFTIILVSDLNYYIIPDSVTIIASIIIIITNYLRYDLSMFLISILNGIIMFILMYLILLLGKFLFKKEALGGGDIKLMFALGMTLPLISSIYSFILAVFIAFPASLYLYIRKKDQVIPFGPFLVGATLLIFLSKIDILSLIQNYV